MKIAVTGANGFVGQAVVAAIARLGGNAVPLVRSASDMQHARVIGDFADSPVDETILAGVDILIHLAARTHVVNDTSVDPLAAYRHTNVSGTQNLLDAAIAAGVSRFVYMSSIKAMGERTQVSQPMSPDTPPQPEDPYGVSKLEAEALVQERCNRAGIGWTIIRPPLVYGPGVKANFDRLIPLAQSAFPIPLGSIRNARSVIYVENLAEATIAAASATDARNRILTLCDDTLSTPELIRAVALALGKSPMLVPFPTALLRLAGRLTGRTWVIDRLTGSLEIDSRSSMAAAHWHPRISTADAMRATVLARQQAPD